MATKPKRNKSTSPPANKAGGEDSPKQEAPPESLPKRIQRSGTRRIHDRPLNAGERRAVNKQRAEDRDAAAKSRQAEREGREAKGWAGRRRER